MKILKLTIHNIASITDAVIDFTRAPLDDAGLFLISGRTGAGKSTILDCICLALYDDTPRLKNTLAKDSVRDQNADDSVASNDTRQMLRKFSSEGFTQLEFIGNNNVKYQATWSVSRARKKLSGKMQSTKRSLERLDTHHVLDKKKEIDAEITRAVNLDFNQFCRTVMLAQGEFTKFLNSNDTDKSAILSKITGTEIYTILGRKIFERYRREEQIFEQCRLSMQNLEMLSEEQLSAKKSEIESLSSAVKDLSSLLSENSAIVTSLTNKHKCEEELKKLASKKINLTRDFKRFLLSLKGLEEEKVELDAKIQIARHELLGFADRQDILNRPESIVSIIDRIEDLDKSVAADRFTISEQKSFKGTKLLPACNKLKKDAEDNATVLQAAQSAATALTAQIDALNLAGLRSERDRLMQSRVDFENLHIHLGRYVRCIEDRESNKRALAEAVKEAETLGKQLEDLKMPVMLAKAKLDVLQENHDKLFASSEKILSKIRSSLHPGDICPVCQSKIITPLPSDDSIAAIIATSKKGVDDARNETDRLNKAIADIEAQIKLKAAEINNLKKKTEDDTLLREAEAKVLEYCGNLDIRLEEIDVTALNNIYAKGIKDLETRASSLKSSIGKGEGLEKELRLKNNAIKDLQDKASEIGKALNAAELKVTACDSKIATLEAHTSAALMNVAALKSEIISLISASRYKDLTDDLQSLKTQINTDAESFKWLNDCVSKFETEARLLVENIKANRETSDVIKIYLPEGSAPDDTDDISPAPQARLLTFGQSIIGELKACAELSAAASKQLSDEERKIRVWIERHPDEPLNVADITTRCHSIQEEMDTKNRTIGALESELELDDANRQKKQKLFDEFTRQEKTLDKWRKLCELFGDAEGKKFRKIAQSYILSELIHSANHYLGGFTERYRLAIEPGTFVIMVEDAWDGYTRRPASTISGGESFMVSLSLALALSDLNTDFSVDILLIDEGFGSLSGEYLQSAISTLRTLHRKSGRRVGIISHVEELREQIPVQILVESSPNSSSSEIIIKS